MQNSKDFFLHKRFSHIYVEYGVQQHRETKYVLEKFPDSNVIPIQSYKEVFNYYGQQFQEQKKSMKLILAKKNPPFLYKGSGITPSFGYEFFYYNSLALNCIFNCDYCYLQGMYPSGNLVLFMNTQDFFRETESRMSHEKPLYLCISYDTDLLALERIFPYTKQWIEFACNHPEMILEVRTKSSDFELIRELQPAENVILAWTISPDRYVRIHEHKTPSLKKRIEAMRSAVENGWKIRLCFDPVLYESGWEAEYSKTISEIFTQISPSSIRDITVGVFRMNSNFFKNAKKRRADSDIYFREYMTVDGVKTIPSDLEEGIKYRMRAMLSDYVSNSIIFTDY